MRQLCTRGFEPIIALHGDGPVAELAAQAGVDAYRSSVSNLVGTQHPARQSFDIVRSLRRSRTELERRGISLVHTNDARLHRLWGPAARSAGRGWIWHQRTPGLSRGMTLLARTADEIITVSTYAHSSLPGMIRGRSHIIDNPFQELDSSSLPNVRSQILASVPGGQPPFVVGLISNLKVPRKRPDTFIRIAGRLNEEGVQAAYPVVGELRPDRLRKLEDIAESAGCRDRIIFAGSQTPASAWIAACDVVIAPAVDEAFGRVLVEAAMLGVPVVAADDGGHREIIDDGRTGFLFAPDDIRIAAQATRRLLTDRCLRDRIAAAASAAARRRFSVDTHADRVTELYAEVLNRRPSARQVTSTPS